MEVIIGLIRQISIIAIMAAFLEMILPNGEMQKFIRFFMGLLILVVFLNPILAWENSGGEMAVIVQSKSPQNQTTGILAAGQEMDRFLQEMAQKSLADDLSSQICALCSLVDGVDNAMVEINLKTVDPLIWEQVNITVWIGNVSEQERILTDIEQMLVAFYQLPKEKIVYHVNHSKEVIENENK